MKNIIFSILLILGSTFLFSQKKNTSIETLFTVNHAHYQHTFHKTLSNSNFSFFNLTSLKTDYTSTTKEQFYLVRNQIFYKLNKSFSIGVTGELSTGKKTARFGLRYLFKNQNNLFSIYPNITFSKTSSLVSMLFWEFKPRISPTVKFYSRLQLQTDKVFNKSNHLSILYRTAIIYKNIKFGLGTPWFSSSKLNALNSEHIGFFIGMQLYFFS